MLNNLTTNQFRLLVNKGIIKENGYLQLYDDELGDYRISKIISGSVYKFLVKNLDTYAMKTVEQNQIKSIEDMDVERIIQAYEVNDELNTYDVKEKTDVEETVIGKEEAILNGIELDDGMRFILHNDVNQKYNNKTLTVSGVGSSIKLSAPRGRPKKNK